MANKKAAKETTEKVNFEEVPGHELLRPAGSIKGSDQARLLASAAKLSDSLGGLQNIDLDNPAEALEKIDFDALADMIDYVGERFAVDVEKFEEFTCGEGGMNRAFVLVFSYLGLLGE